MKLAVYVGFAGLKLCNALPANGSRFQLGQKKLRAFFGQLYLNTCGKEVNIQKNTRFSHTCSLGDRSGIGEGSVLYGPVSIGKDVMMGTECIIYTQNHRFDDLSVPMDQQGFQEVKPVTIADNVWIGGRVTILPGVHIGSGAVIGAGSVVTKAVPDNAVVGGNPARVIRMRGQTSPHPEIRQNEQKN